jgi:tetratricopeptide (TPR) repeat protein
VFELKLLSREGIPGALAKAERYRLLNQPWEAESIYRDVLEVDPDNQEATIGLVLAITDQFESGSAAIVPRAREALLGLRDEYQQAYYAGIICERRARVLLQSARPGSGSMAHELLREARSWYEQAEVLRPPGNDDVLLRWNACARLLMRHPEAVTATVESFQPYSDS